MVLSRNNDAELLRLASVVHDAPDKATVQPTSTAATSLLAQAILSHACLVHLPLH